MIQSARSIAAWLFFISIGFLLGVGGTVLVRRIFFD